MKGSVELVQGLNQLLPLWRGRRGLGHGDLLVHSLDLDRGVLRGSVHLLGKVADRLGGVLSHAHALGERGHGLEECGRVHLCKCAAIPDLENGFRGGWVEGQKCKKENLRYPI